MISIDLLTKKALLAVVGAEAVRGRQHEQVVDQAATALAAGRADLALILLHRKYIHTVQ